MRRNAAIVIITGVVTLLLAVVYYHNQYKDHHFLVFEWQNSELLRVASPTGKVEAVLMESNKGAMSTLLHSVFVVPAGKHPKLSDKDSRAIVAEYLTGVQLQWSGDNTLDIRYQTVKAIREVADHVEVGGQEYAVKVSMRAD